MIINNSTQIQAVHPESIETLHLKIGYQQNLKNLWLWDDKIYVGSNNKSIRFIYYFDTIKQKNVIEYFEINKSEFKFSKFINKEYIYKTEEFYLLNEPHQKKIKRKIKQFESLDLHYSIKSYALNKINKNTLIQKYIILTQHNSKNERLKFLEYKALIKLLNNSLILKNYQVIYLYIKNNIEGFAVIDFFDFKTAYLPFIRTNVNIKSSMYFLFQQVAIYLNKLGVKFINFEDDMGMEGLKQFKSTLCPYQIDKKEIYFPEGKEYNFAIDLHKL